MYFILYFVFFFVLGFFTTMLNNFDNLDFLKFVNNLTTEILELWPSCDVLNSSVVVSEHWCRGKWILVNKDDGDDEWNWWIYNMCMYVSLSWNRKKLMHPQRATCSGMMQVTWYKYCFQYWQIYFKIWTNIFKIWINIFCIWTNIFCIWTNINGKNDASSTYSGMKWSG